MATAETEIFYNAGSTLFDKPLAFLKGLIVASTRNVEAVVREIRERGLKMGGGGQAVDASARPPRPQPDLGRRHGARFGERASQ